MNFKNSIKTLCENLGKNNKATYVMVSVAAAKGIFRPMFTMADKKEAPETKKYTAWREGLTEALAVPIYLTVDALVNAITKKIVPEDAPKIKGLKPRRVAGANLNLIGICIAGGLIVPAACFLVVRPITAKMFKDKAQKDAQGSDTQLDVVSITDTEQKTYNPELTQNIQPLGQSAYSMHKFMNNGMRVGL